MTIQEFQQNLKIEFPRISDQDASRIKTNLKIESATSITTHLGSRRHYDRRCDHAPLRNLSSIGGRTVCRRFLDRICNVQSFDRHISTIISDRRIPIPTDNSNIYFVVLLVS